MTLNDCPSTDELQRYVRNHLPHEKVADFDGHFSSCRDCLQRLFELGRRDAGAEISNCRIVKEIGRGRFGVVYKGWWAADTPRVVAVKILSGHSQMERDRFEREIHALQKLDSPGIVRLLDSGTTHGSPYYVMDLVDGVHLDEYLANNTNSLDEKLEVLERVCEAVADAHAAGIVHRDLKPSNILVDRDGQPHILDFGVCTVTTPDWTTWERVTVTHPGDIIGTLKYMSPEQAWGGVAGPADERADLWALGIMLYEIVTDGGYPYSMNPTPDKPAHEALLERIRKELPRLPRLAHLPRGRDLEILIERCLAWEPEKRIDSARLLADDLVRYGHGKRIRTKPMRLRYRLKRRAIGVALHSRWAFGSFFFMTTVMLLWLITFFFGVSWHETGTAYLGGSRATPVAADGARENIVIVGTFDDTPQHVESLAAEAGIPDVTRSMTTWRAVHARVLNRLTPVQPRAVAWDYFFRTDQPGDEQFADAILESERAGIPVVLSANNYEGDGTPELSSTLMRELGDKLRYGAITARDQVARPGEVLLAARRVEGGIIPSLILSTVAAVLHPEAMLDLDWVELDDTLTMLYRHGPRSYLRARDRVNVNLVVRAQDSMPAFDIGDRLAYGKFALRTPDFWEERTFPYESILTGDTNTLRERFAGKVVFFGDVRNRAFLFAADRHAVDYGSQVIHDVPGVYILADAIANMLDRTYVRTAYPLRPTLFVALLLIAFAGCFVPVPLVLRALINSKRRRIAVWAVLIAASAVTLVLLANSHDKHVVHLALAAAALLPPFAGMLWVELARNRHRMLDRGRQSLDALIFETGQTSTITQPKTTPP